VAIPDNHRTIVPGAIEPQIVKEIFARFCRNAASWSQINDWHISDRLAMKQILQFCVHQKIFAERTRSPLVPSDMIYHQLENFEFHLIFSVSRCDSEKKVSQSMKVPDFDAFSSVYQFLLLSRHSRSMYVTRVIGIQWFACPGG
jgi:hypothetical protein